jgi:hypothetical protein
MFLSLENKVSSLYYFNFEWNSIRSLQNILSNFYFFKCCRILFEIMSASNISSTSFLRIKSFHICMPSELHPSDVKRDFKALFWWKHPWITDYIVILCEAFFSPLLLSLQRRKAKVVKKSSTAEWRINFAPQKVIIVLMMRLAQWGRICYEIAWTKFSPKLPKSPPFLQLSSENPSKGDYRSDDETCSMGSNLLWNCMNKV